MKKLLILFALLLSVLGCAPELAIDKADEKGTEIKDSILPFKPGSRDSVWLEEEK